MTIVGFNFTKIHVEKKTPLKGKINISNNVSIKDVHKADLSLGDAKQEGLRYVFLFTSTYDPDVGNIELGGDVLFIGDKARTKRILDAWKKDKQVPSEEMTAILNTVLAKSNVEALLMSREVNLPPPIPMPKVNMEGAGKKK
ncbi:MAG: hypothetical protein GXP63_06565 [DPANN group archaeon]|nr:hypothetical protein [DPANN group archaeon]